MSLAWSVALADSADFRDSTLSGRRKTEAPSVFGYLHITPLMEGTEECVAYVAMCVLCCGQGGPPRADSQYLPSFGPEPL